MTRGNPEPPGAITGRAVGGGKRKVGNRGLHEDRLPVCTFKSIFFFSLMHLPGNDGTSATVASSVTCDRGVGCNDLPLFQWAILVKGALSGNSSTFRFSLWTLF